jgi:MFS family permease
VMGSVTIPLHAILLRRRPADVGLVPDGERGGLSAGFSKSVQSPGIPARTAIHSRSFRWLALAFGFSSLVATAAGVHVIPLLLERGHPPAFAGAVVAGIGLMALPGRLIFTPLGDRWSRPAVTGSIFALQALGLIALMLSTQTTAVWIFIAFYGAGQGAITPARAALVADLYGSAEYGRINGAIAVVLSIARAAGPVGASLLYGLAGGYGPVLWVLLFLSAISMIAVLRAGQPDPDPGLRLARAAP